VRLLRPEHRMYDLNRLLGVLSVAATVVGVAFIFAALEGIGPFASLPATNRFFLAPAPFLVVFALRQIAGRLIGIRCPHCDARLTLVRMAWGRAEMRAYYTCNACGKWRQWD